MWFLRARCSVFQMVVRWYIWYTVICEQDYLPYEGHFTITFNASLETALHWVFVMLQQIYCRLFYLIFMLSLRKDYSFCSYFTCGMNGTRCEEWSRRESQDHRSPASVCEIPYSFCFEYWPRKKSRQNQLLPSLLRSAVNRKSHRQ